MGCVPAEAAVALCDLAIYVRQVRCPAIGRKVAGARQRENPQAKASTRKRDQASTVQLAAPSTNSLTVKHTCMSPPFAHGT